MPLLRYRYAEYQRVLRSDRRGSLSRADRRIDASDSREMKHPSPRHTVLNGTICAFFLRQRCVQSGISLPLVNWLCCLKLLSDIAIYNDGEYCVTTRGTFLPPNNTQESMCGRFIMFLGARSLRSDKTRAGQSPSQAIEDLRAKSSFRTPVLPTCTISVHKNREGSLGSNTYYHGTKNIHFYDLNLASLKDFVYFCCRRKPRLRYNIQHVSVKEKVEAERPSGSARTPWK